MSVVKILRSTKAGAIPAALQSGQIAINEADGILFWLDAASGTVFSFNFNNPTAPTRAAGDNSTLVATTAFVQAVAAALLAGAPSGLSTLKALADAIGDDPHFAASMSTALANRLRVDAAQSLTAAQQAQVAASLGLGTAATRNAGTGAGNVVQLDGNGKLPAVDGSQLSNLGLSWGNLAGKPTNVSYFANDAGYLNAVNTAGTNPNLFSNPDAFALTRSGNTIGLVVAACNCNCNCGC